MTPNPVDLVHEALQRRSVLDIHRGDVMDVLNVLRDHGLDIVRFSASYGPIPAPMYDPDGVAVLVERWPGDDSHLHPAARP